MPRDSDKAYMTKAQTKIFVTLFTISASITGGLSGCASAPGTPATAQATRNPAADESAVIRVFTEALAKESGLGSKTEVEKALDQIVRDNSDSLSNGLKGGQQIRSLDDISALEEADQKKILNRLVRMPGFAERLATNPDVVSAARLEAIASQQEVKAVSTEAVTDLHASQAAKSDGPFATIVERAPELKGDVDQMVAEDHFIAQKTGTNVLDKGCDQLQDPESAKNVATMIEGVRRDVASGDAKDADGVSKSLRKNMGYTLGTKPEETNRRVCVLAKPDGCRVFTPAMCRE